MRQLNDVELKALLKGAQDGILDLRTMPGYRDAIPEIFYGECTRHNDGTITWEAKHLPIVDRQKWEGLCNQLKREPIVKLSKADRAEIVKASVFGRIDESLLPQIYPLVQKPRLADIVYLHFTMEDEQKKQIPDVPDEWANNFVGALEPCNGRVFFATFSHFDYENLNGRFEFQKEAEPFDYSTGKPLEDASMANFYDNIALGIGMLAH